MSGKRKILSGVSDDEKKHIVIETEQYQRERDGDEDPHEVEERQWFNKEQMTCYQISSNPTNSSFPTPEHRLILFDWMREVCKEWGHHILTWYMACNYVDRYIISTHPNKQIIYQQKYQLLGVTCLWIAGKIEETWSPEMDQVVEISDHCFTIRQVISMEYSIIEVLHADFRPPTVYAWIEHMKPNLLKDNIKLQFILVCMQLDPLFATLVPSQVAKSLIKNNGSHILFSHLKRYEEIYEKNKDQIDYDLKLQMVGYFNKLPTWKEWIKLEITT